MLKNDYMSSYTNSKLQRAGESGNIFSYPSSDQRTVYNSMNAYQNNPTNTIENNNSNKPFVSNIQNPQLTNVYFHPNYTPQIGGNPNQGNGFNQNNKSFNKFNNGDTQSTYNANIGNQFVTPRSQQPQKKLFSRNYDAVMDNPFLSKVQSTDKRSETNHAYNIKGRLMQWDDEDQIQQQEQKKEELKMTLLAQIQEKKIIQLEKMKFDLLKQQEAEVRYRKQQQDIETMSRSNLYDRDNKVINSQRRNQDRMQQDHVTHKKEELEKENKRKTPSKLPRTPPNSNLNMISRNSSELNHNSYHRPFDYVNQAADLLNQQSHHAFNNGNSNFPSNGNYSRNSQHMKSRNSIQNLRDLDNDLYNYQNRIQQEEVHGDNRLEKLKNDVLIFYQQQTQAQSDLELIRENIKKQILRPNQNSAMDNVSVSSNNHYIQRNMHVDNSHNFFVDNNPMFSNKNLFELNQIIQRAVQQPTAQSQSPPQNTIIEESEKNQGLTQKKNQQEVQDTIHKPEQTEQDHDKLQNTQSTNLNLVQSPQQNPTSPTPPVPPPNVPEQVQKQNVGIEESKTKAETTSKPPQQSKYDSNQQFLYDDLPTDNLKQKQQDQENIDEEIHLEEEQKKDHVHLPLNTSKQREMHNESAVLLTEVPSRDHDTSMMNNNNNKSLIGGLHFNPNEQLDFSRFEESQETQFSKKSRKLIQNDDGLSTVSQKRNIIKPPPETSYTPSMLSIKSNQIYSQNQQIRDQQQQNPFKQNFPPINLENDQNDIDSLLNNIETMVKVQANEINYSQQKYSNNVYESEPRYNYYQN